jgi:transketolase
MGNISQRDAFWNRIYDLAKGDKDLVIITADMGAPALDKIRRDISSQFINVGIAEQNAITIAAGLALSGKKVFTYAIAPFITLRCLEQIRVECAMMKLPITIVGVGGGFGYEDSGPTHHLTEDIAVMRSMPHITINSITDSVMAAVFAEMSCKMQTTNYVRLDRQVFPNIYDDKADFSKGIAVLRESKDFYIISTGSMTHTAMEITHKLKEKKINVGVIDIYTLPINKDLFVETVKGAKRLVTMEEHFLPGGFGSAVCEVLNDNNLLIPVKRIGLPIEQGYCYKYGGREIIRGYYGVDKQSIEGKVIAFLS